MTTSSYNVENGNPGEEEEEDYMSMVIAEPTKPREKETYTQRRMRKEREVCYLLIIGRYLHHQ